MIRLKPVPYTEVFMPFGRHRGERVCTVPRRYLWWCLLNLDEMSPTVERAMWRTLKAL